MAKVKVGRGRRKIWSKEKIYAEIAKDAGIYINRLKELAHSKNEAIAVSALKTLMSKVVADLKATEFSTKDNQPLLIRVVWDQSMQIDDTKHDTKPKLDDSKSTDKKLPKTTSDI